MIKNFKVKLSRMEKQSDVTGHNFSVELEDEEIGFGFLTEYEIHKFHGNLRLQKEVSENLYVIFEEANKEITNGSYILLAILLYKEQQKGKPTCQLKDIVF